ncbi:hypothetical protein [Burkholderia oklahomensis]|uniref:hypothetical protein n=2 Tax=Burkholderia oklahomensis TaxID=342113 RepID=UPI001F297ADD|nr:hypothetical protein [Burkholderia oklahomensis]
MPIQRSAISRIGAKFRPCEFPQSRRMVAARCKAIHARDPREMLAGRPTARRQPFAGFGPRPPAARMQQIERTTARRVRERKRIEYEIHGMPVGIASFCNLEVARQAPLRC